MPAKGLRSFDDDDLWCSTLSSTDAIFRTMTSAKFRSALRELAVGTLNDWLGATRCRLFGRHLWEVADVSEMPCGGQDVTIFCPRCEDITVAQHRCCDGDHGGGPRLPKPSTDHADHLDRPTQPKPELSV